MHGHGEVLQRDEDRHTHCTTLTRGADIGGGVAEYRLRLSHEARAVLEAAIGPLSAPPPGSGEQADAVRDPRSFEQRREEALVEVCRTATTAAETGISPSGAKASVFVTVNLAALRDLTKPRATIGGRTPACGWDRTPSAS